jgi:hypothetical protein
MNIEFHSFQVLFYAVVFIFEIYKVVDHIIQKKKLAETIDNLNKFLVKTYDID